MNNIGKGSLDIRYMDVLARGFSPLHRIEPRIKLLTTMIFIITVISFNRYAILPLTAFFIFPVSMIYLGALPAGYLLKKVLLVAPFAVLVGIFNPFLDKQTIFYLGNLGITGGWLSFFSIILRFLLTAMAAFILISSTGVDAVSCAMIRLKVPRPLVVQLLFFYRYVFVLDDEAERMVRAGSLRSFNSQAIALRAYKSLTGNLLLRTLDRAERIYLAMCSRGFDGNVRVGAISKIGRKDLFFICGWTLIFIALRHFNLPLILGKLITGI